MIDADAPSILTVDCEGLASSRLELTSELTVQSIIDPTQNTIEMEFVLDRLAWMAMAFTNGQPGMVGAEAVMGFPTGTNDNPPPAKFSMAAKTVDGVTPMDPERQTLINPAITQTGTQTILKFTKYLFEDGEHPIYSDRTNTLLFAHGSNNEAGFHISYGSFELLPNQCAVYLKGELQNDFALNQQGIDAGVDEADMNRNLWVLHGAFASIAWGILVPLAVGASMIRTVLVKTLGLSEGAWFQIHRGLNGVAALLTLAAFWIGVRAINEGTVDNADPDHFTSDIPHRRIGLVIFLLTMAQAINGILRPHNKKHGSEEKDTKEGSSELSRTIRTDPGNASSHGAASRHMETIEIGEQESTESPTPVTHETDENEPSAANGGNSLVRAVWSVFHRLLGFALLGLAWWHVRFN